MSPQPLSAADVAGLVGLVCFCGLLVAALPWPHYRDPEDFAHPADRRAAVEQLRQHERLRQGAPAETARETRRPGSDPRAARRLHGA
jgi:hypothetical protein